MCLRFEKTDFKLSIFFLAGLLWSAQVLGGQNQIGIQMPGMAPNECAKAVGISLVQGSKTSSESSDLKGSNSRLLLALLRTPHYITQIREVSDRIALRLVETLNPEILERFFTPRARVQIQDWMKTVKPIEHLAELSQQFGISRKDALSMALVDGENLVREMFNARNNQNWDEVIRIYDEVLPNPWKNVVETKLQAALALNRRNGNNGIDRERAKKLTQFVIDTSPGKAILSEAYGIRARIFKDEFAESKKINPPNGNPNLLSKAIRTYLRGFHENPMDFYPGVAALTLLLVRDMPGDMDLIRSYSELVQEALDNTMSRLRDRGLIADYWTYATAVLLYVLNGEWKKVSDVLPDLIANSGGKQNLESTLGDLIHVQNHWRKELPSRSTDLTFLNSVIDALRGAADISPPGLSLGENSPVFVSNLKFPDMENVFYTNAYMLKSDLLQTEIASDLNRLSRSSRIPILSFHKFLQQSPVKREGVLLAATGPYGEIVSGVSKSAGLTYWREAYANLGIVASPANSEIFLEKLAETGTPIYFLIPKKFKSVHAGSHTLAEFEYIMKNWARFSHLVHFVIGFETVIPLNYESRLNPNDLPVDSQAISLLFLNRYKKWLERLGDKVKEYSLGSQFSGSLYPLIYDVTLGQNDLHREMRQLHVQSMPTGIQGRPTQIVDMGGGTGLLARDLERSGLREVEIFDSSPEMTKVAVLKGLPEERISTSSIWNLIRSDGNSVGDGTIDGVTCSNVLYLLTMEQIQQVFAEAFRVLKPGGRFSISSMAEPKSQSDTSHTRFLEALSKNTEELERSGKIPPGAAKVMSQANGHLLEREPTFLTEQKLIEFGRSVGFRVPQLAQSYYLGAGIFMVFEKPK